VTISPANGQTTTLNNGNSIVLVGANSTITVGAGVTINQTAGGTAALEIQGAGTVTNAGSVNSTAFNGITIGGDGTVNNTGTVSATNQAIYINGVGTVTSTNSITSTGNSGIYITGNGTVNLSGPLQASNYGIFIGGSGAVTSTNSINTTGNSAIHISGPGSANLSGTVTTNNYGVYIGGAGTVTNSAIITATGNNGVYINGDGTLTNTGSITSNSNSAVVINGVGHVTNSGTLQGNLNSGLQITGSSTLFSNVTNSGTIKGNTGIYITGLANVTNSGAVNATGNSAIIIEGSSSGTSTVNNSGTITSSINGIYASNETDVTNSGTITGGVNAVNLTNKGTFTMNGGSATGTNNGVYINGFSAASTVTLNSGSVTGTNNMGLHLDGNSTVTLGETASVTGGGNGIFVSGNGTVTNAGAINGLGNVGIYISGSSDLAVTPTGTVLGNWNGIQAGGSGSLFNSGSIIAQNNIGVYFGGSGNVTLAGGSITSPGASVYTNSAASTITVQGRTSLTNGSGGAGLLYNGVGTGSLVLNLVGMSPAEVTAFNALLGTTSGTVNAAGEEYVYENLLLSGKAVSLQLAVDPGLVGLATQLDSLTTPLPQSFDAFYLAALEDPQAALTALSGRQINNAIGNIGINQATNLAGQINNHIDHSSVGGTGGIDSTGFRVNSSSSLAMADTQSQLEALMNLNTGSLLAKNSNTMSTDPQPLPVGRQDIDAVPVWNTWASGNVTLADQSTTQTTPGFQATTGTPTVGADYRFSKNLLAGGILSFSTTEADFADGSRLNADTGVLGIYGAWQEGRWHVKGIAAGGYTNYEIERKVLGATANSDPSGWQFLTDWTGGYDISLGRNWTFTPEVGLGYTHLGVSGYTEDGAGAFNLNVGQQDIDSLRSHLGGRLNASLKCGDVTFIPEVRAAWYHEFLDDSRGVNTSLPGAPGLGSFAVQTGETERDFAMIGVGLNTLFTAADLPMAVFIDYNAQAGQDNYLAHNIDAGLRIGF